MIKVPLRLRKAVRWLVLLLVAYVAFCAIVILLQNHLIFLPSKRLTATPADEGLLYENVHIPVEPDVALHAWFIPSRDAKLTILYCHGNAGNISGRVGRARILHDLGCSVLLFDYRGYGRSTGSPSERGVYADAAAARQYLVASRGIEASTLVYYGRSLGGAVAIELARRSPPAALVVESTFTRLADVARLHYGFLPVDWILGRRFDSVSKIPALRCPSLMFHGRDDGLVPIELGRTLFAAAPEPKQWIETPGGHQDAGFSHSPEYTEALRAFLRGIEK